MDELLEIIFQIVFEAIQSFLRAGFRDLVKGELFTSENWEVFGALGAFAWAVVSLGRIKWEAFDRRAIASGVVLFMGILGSGLWWFFTSYHAMI